MGLGTVRESGVYLSVAGGYIWNRKADSSDPNYAVQTFTKADKSEGQRQGARYADISGLVTGVHFKTHQEYGESVNVLFEADGAKYIISISTNNRYSQDMMKALLKMDLDKEVYMKPYDFVGDDNRRAQGLVFRQDGEKIALRHDDAPSHDSEWFKKTDKKQIKRFFEDLNDWFVAEVEEKVCSQFTNAPVKNTEKEEETKEEPKTGLGTSKQDIPKEEPVAEKPKKATAKVEEVTPLKMRKALRSYIEENYPGESLPKLSAEDLVTWYNLSLEDDELPFEVKGGEVDSNDLDAQLSALTA